MEPKNYVGDDFSRITQIYRVTQYNIACCYAAMGSVRAGCVPQTVDRRRYSSSLAGPCQLAQQGGALTDELDLLQVDAGIEALSDALRSGFDQYKVCSCSATSAAQVEASHASKCTSETSLLSCLCISV